MWVTGHFRAPSVKTTEAKKVGTNEEFRLLETATMKDLHPKKEEETEESASAVVSDAAASVPVYRSYTSRAFDSCARDIVRDAVSVRR